MISTALINLGYYMISGLISWLPSGSYFSSTVHTAVTALGGYLDILSPIVPVSTMLTVLTLVFGFEMSLFAFRTLKWIISHLPFVGGK